MVIVMPAFTESYQSEITDVMALHGSSLDVPVSVSVVVGEITNDPMAKN